MADFTKKSFPLGWIPSDDEFNGRDDGLLRMDNCELDELGIVNGIRAPVAVSNAAFTSYGIKNLWSKVLNLNALSGSYTANSKVRYAYDENGTLWRNYEPVLKAVNVYDTVFTSGTAPKCQFVNALGHVFLFSGSKHYKDSGILPAKTVGMVSPSAPTLAAVAAPSVNVDNRTSPGGLYTNWDAAAVENDITYDVSSDYVLFDNDLVTFRGIVQVGKDTATTIDTTNFGSTGQETPGDIFKFSIRISDSNAILQVRVEFLLQAPGTVSTTEDVTDYFFKEWTINESQIIQVPIDPPLDWEYKDDPDYRDKFEQQYREERQIVSVIRLGSDQWTTLQCLRSEFTRIGTDQTKNWNNVKGVRVSVTGTGALTICFNDLKFIGGIDVLNGTYKYIQVDVANTTHYNEQSLVGAESAEIYIINGRVTVTPSTVNANANECWIFRASKNIGGYVLVKKITGAYGFTPGAFTDDVSDVEAARLYTSLAGLRLEVTRTALPSDIVGAIWFADRMIYLTYSAFIPSFKLDPGSYDSRFTYRLGASFGDTCYFIAKISEGEFLVGTNNDIYNVSGNFGILTLPDGTQTLDVNIRPLGIKKPPVNDAHYVDNGFLYYLGEDGWYKLGGTSNENFCLELVELYKKKTRHGLAPVSALSNNSAIINCTKSKGRFLAAMQHDTIDRTMHIYNEKRGYWTLWYCGNYYDPMAIYAEEDGTVIMAGKVGANNFIYEWDSSASLGDIPHKILTTFNHFGQPHRRKDLSGFSLIVDTDGKDYTLKIRYVDSAGFTQEVTAGTVNTAGYEEVFFDPTVFTLQKSYQIELSGTTGRLFRFYGFCFYYELRPEQVRRFKFGPTNLNDPRRKRINTWPLYLDSMGGTVTMTPRLDGVNKTTSSHISSEPRTLFHYFTEDQVAVDLEYTLTSTTPFEVHGTPPPNITEYFPISAKFFTMESKDFGKPTRKDVNTWPLLVNPAGGTITATPKIDGTSKTPSTHTGSGIAQLLHYYSDYQVGVMHGITLEGTQPFDLWQVYPPNFTYEHPQKAKYLKIHEDDFGKPVRKDFCTIPVRLNSLGNNVDITPSIDGTDKTSSTANTNRPQYVNHYYTDLQTGTNHGFVLESNDPFEFHGLGSPLLFEHPQRAKYVKIRENDFGSPVRKDVSTVPVKIDSLGSNVNATPTIDGVSKTPSILNTSDSQFTNHYYTDLQFGVNHGMIFDGVNPFELYGLGTPFFTTVHPQKARFIQRRPTNLGESGRKKVQTWPFTLNSFGVSVSVTPNVDGSNLAVASLNTNDTRTQNYYSETNVTGVDFGYIASAASPFELSPESGPKVLEIYPTKVKYIKLDRDNLGLASKKRIRTWPFRLHTFNGTVTVTPNVDGSNLAIDTYINNESETENYFFTTDAFGVDYGMEFSGTNPFEIKNLMGQGNGPLSVQNLVQPKTFDQIGPLEVYKIGTVKSLRIRVIPLSSSIDYVIYDNDVSVNTGTLTVIPNVEDYYEIIVPFEETDFRVIRVTFSSDLEFYRTYAVFKIQETGKETQYKYVEVS